MENTKTHIKNRDATQCFETMSAPRGSSERLWSHWSGDDLELQDGQSRLTNQKAGQQQHLCQTENSRSSTVPAEDAFASEASRARSAL